MTHLARLRQELVGQELVSEVRNLTLLGPRLLLRVHWGDVGDAVRRWTRGEWKHWY